MVKIDLGAHMDGYIVVAAHTVIVKEVPVAGNTEGEREKDAYIH
jgi:methionine aminopeptidase